jgi:hypothetical protein
MSQNPLCIHCRRACARLGSLLRRCAAALRSSKNLPAFGDLPSVLGMTDTSTVRKLRTSTLSKVAYMFRTPSVLLWPDSASNLWLPAQSNLQVVHLLHPGRLYKIGTAFHSPIDPSRP